MNQKSKKYLLLSALFFMPILALVFFVKAQYNFKPVDRMNIMFSELPTNEQKYSLDGKISIVSFLGGDIENNKNVFFNLNQKINKRFGVYKHLRLVVVSIDENKSEIQKILDEMSATSEIEKWNIVYLTKREYQRYYDSTLLENPLDDNMNAEFIYLIDETKEVRGRNDDKDLGVMIGFDPNDVSQVNKLKDDVKMLLKEHSVHYNENKADRKKSNIQLQEQ